MTDLRAAAQQALEACKLIVSAFDALKPASAARNEPLQINAARASITALEAALEAALAGPVQEPWGTRERFYEAIDRAVENVRQEMRIKTVTMRLPEYDVAMPIIDAYSGHVLVGPVPTPPQRKPLTEEEIEQEYKKGYADGYAAGYDNGDSEGFTRGTDSMAPASLAAWRAETKPLTDEQIRDLWSWAMTAEAERTATTQQHAFARAIERAHGIGGNDE